ncbi:sugar porter family MFS transporter [Francisella tularensis]|uniref:sugar porter family MFS transporter n=1 Tax=Francisella tularensis TaxID=263 RepID=UPI000158AFE8|nr:sugar porter family MFS transporter [Francisella tularensis]AJI45493.1 MFS transporter, sugar porter family protein [Francisella tularensis subsp. novicida F6168]AJJ46963.1 MFS transporter, sugar porter family protein [Francisella tularensis subsp. novicida]APC95389.1 MFS transporter, sugar porter family protein [Francisella tularensis subsp. novicida]APC98572.1 MFS transporter, sugar porter family protein [Francisella tularensis subsp. novicida]EDN36037.1 galactose-proton symporter [Franci
MQTEKKINFVVVRVAIIAALAGLLFGMDIGYVNGSLHFISETFDLSVEQSGHVSSVLLLGAACGALFSGFLSKRYGRRKVLLIAAAIFSIFTIVGILAPNYQIFISSRFILGIAVGIASFIAPLYLSEIAPKEFRGALIALYQLMITIGLFLVFLTNSALERTGSWRVMLAVLAIPSVIMFFGCLTLPRSPRWLILKGNDNEAALVLKKIRSSEAEALEEHNEIKQTTHRGVSVFSLLKQKFFIKVVLLGIALQAFQQFTGMNAFMYYSTDIFKLAGFTNPSTSTIVIGLLNMLTTFLAIKYVDKFGRKPILYFGLSLLIISCIIVGFIFKTHFVYGQTMVLSQTLQWTALIFCLLFIFGFAISMGPVIWILCSEIQPIEGRDFGVTASTMSNWICNAIIGNFALTWLTFHPDSTFFGFAISCIICILFVKFFVPETKDVSLEEIENNLRSGKSLARIGR